MVLSKILCKWKQDSVVSLFLYLDSVFKYNETRSHTDGFRRNNANYWNKREICRFYLYSSIIWKSHSTLTLLAKQNSPLWP